MPPVRQFLCTTWKTQNELSTPLLQTFDQCEICTETSKVYFKERVEKHSLEDPDKPLLFLNTFFDVYRSSWISSSHPQMPLKVFQIDSEFPEFHARESFEHIFGQNCENMGFISMLDDRIVVSK